MSVTNKHPRFNEFSDHWRTMRHTHEGEDAVKENGIMYLPPTSGMIQDGLGKTHKRVEDDDGNILTVKATTTDGDEQYLAYVKRAVYPEMVSIAVEAMIGIMHNKPANIELPSSMESMRESATLQGESLQMLLRRINEEQLITGRLGLLADLPSQAVSGDVNPYIALYQAEAIRNWDDGHREDQSVDNLNLVVLDESGDERQADLSWTRIEKYRVLALGELDANEDPGEGAVYRQQVVRVSDGKGTVDESAFIEPAIRGTRNENIPFVFINSKDIVTDPDRPPLLGLANKTLTIYRGEADYRQNLFMQGQDTLVTIGYDDTQGPIRTGAGASINLDLQGDAKYIGVSANGLPEQRQALENDYSRAAQHTGEMVDTLSRQKESEGALKIRVSARTATLNQIAISGAFGLQSLLRNVAIWKGANPEEVIVTPNLDFVDDELTGKALTEYMQAKLLGAPISYETIHKIMSDRGVTEKTYQEELDAITAEEPDSPGSSVSELLTQSLKPQENDDGDLDDEDDDADDDAETDDDDDGDDE